MQILYLHVHVAFCVKCLMYFLDIPKEPPIELTALEFHVKRLQDEDVAKEEFVVIKLLIVITYTFVFISPSSLPLSVSFSLSVSLCLSLSLPRVYQSMHGIFHRLRLHYQLML